jgi:hypothetical protein
MAKEVGYSSREYELWVNLNQILQCGKTSPALFPVTLDEILRQSSPHFGTSGRVTLRGEFLTLNTLDSPKDAAVCSLWQILEENAPQKYYLSATAARGILRRAEKRGRMLPPQLRRALEAVALGVSPAPEVKQIG